MSLRGPSRRVMPAHGHGGSNRVTQKTSSLTIRICYPHHPLCGRELEVAVMPHDGRGAVTVWTPDGDRLKVPAWMLSVSAAVAPLCARAALGRTALMSLAGLVGLAASQVPGQRAPGLCSLSKTGLGPRREADEIRETARPGMGAGADPDRSRGGSSKKAREAHGRGSRDGVHVSEGGRR